VQKPKIFCSANAIAKNPKLLMKAQKIKRRVISSETRQIEIHFGSGKTNAKRCEICGDDSLMLSPENIADILPVKRREIYRRIEADKVHFAEINKNEILVCIKSLSIKSGHEPIQKEGS
jgi:hypothetical protein